MRGITTTIIHADSGEAEQEGGVEAVTVHADGDLNVGAAWMRDENLRGFEVETGGEFGAFVGEVLRGNGHLIFYRTRPQRFA